MLTPFFTFIRSLLIYNACSASLKPPRFVAQFHDVDRFLQKLHQFLSFRRSQRTCKILAQPVTFGNRTTTQTALVMILMCLTAMFIILGNSLVIFTIYKEKSLRAPQNIYLISLAVADLFVDLFIIPINITNQLNGWYWPFVRTFCEVNLALGFFLSSVSIYHLVAVAHHRCHVVKKGILYTRDISFEGVFGKLAMVYVFSVYLASPPLLGWGGGNWVKDLEVKGQWNLFNVVRCGLHHVCLIWLFLVANFCNVVLWKIILRDCCNSELRSS